MTLIHGEDPDSGEDNASAEEESSEKRDVPPEREDPPERSDPSEQADLPQREPESQQDVEDNSRRSLPEYDGRGARCVAKSRRPVFRFRLRLGSRTTCHSKERGNIPWVKPHV
jgi:hypothetical protein